MPTGYTSKLYEGESQTPREFILMCSRAFGATIDQRDEPFVSYHDEALAKARVLVKEAPAWSDEEADRRAWAEHVEAVTAWRKSEAKRAEIRARYEAMLMEVDRWSPPTADHQGLKVFMIEQLRGGIDFDCKPYDPPAARLGSEYRADVIKQANRDVEYHTKERAEKIRRAASANAWIAALYESLPAGPAPSEEKS